MIRVGAAVVKVSLQRSRCAAVTMAAFARLWRNERELFVKDFLVAQAEADSTRVEEHSACLKLQRYDDQPISLSRAHLALQLVAGCACAKGFDASKLRCSLDST